MLEHAPSVCNYVCLWLTAFKLGCIAKSLFLTSKLIYLAHSIKFMLINPSFFVQCPIFTYLFILMNKRWTLWIERKKKGCYFLSVKYCFSFIKVCAFYPLAIARGIIGLLAVFVLRKVCSEMYLSGQS